MQVSEFRTTMTPTPFTAAKLKTVVVLSVVTEYVEAISNLPFGPSKTIIAFMVLQFIDWITGIWASKREGKAVTSGEAAKGAFKKGMMWAYICVGAVGTWLSPISVDTRSAIFSAIVAMFCWVEIISIAENGERLGIPMPAPLRKLLSGLRPDGASDIPVSGQVVKDKP